jgi:rhodanese-related sulfurtransferase
MSLPEITVSELALRLEQNTSPVQLIDVREPEEIAIAHISGFTVLPLSQFPQWSSTLTENFDPEVETLVICHHGVRSAQMCQWLINQGFTNVKNIQGGIDAYSLNVDPNLVRY